MALTAPPTGAPPPRCSVRDSRYKPRSCIISYNECDDSSPCFEYRLTAKSLPHSYSFEAFIRYLETARKNDKLIKSENNQGRVSQNYVLWPYSRLPITDAEIAAIIRIAERRRDSTQNKPIYDGYITRLYRFVRNTNMIQMMTIDTYWDLMNSLVDEYCSDIDSTTTQVIVEALTHIRQNFNDSDPITEFMDDNLSTMTVFEYLLEKNKKYSINNITYDSVIFEMNLLLPYAIRFLMEQNTGSPNKMLGLSIDTLYYMYKFLTRKEETEELQTRRHNLANEFLAHLKDHPMYTAEALRLLINTLQDERPPTESSGGGKKYVVYKGKRYKVRTGKRGGSYILVNKKKKYISA
jgi:hypothetical protein